MNRSAEDKLLNPKPGSYAARARDFGIDLTLLIENLRRSPAERLRTNDRAVNDLAKLRAAVIKDGDKRRSTLR